MLKRRKDTDYVLSLKKLEFVSVMAVAANYFKTFVVDSKGQGYIFADAFRLFTYRHKDSDLQFSSYLKIPVDITFEKMDGLGLLVKEGKESKATIRFKDAKYVLLESNGFFYNVLKELKDRSGHKVETMSGLIGPYSIDQVGFKELLDEFKVSDEGKEQRFEEFKTEFHTQGTIKKEYKYFCNYQSKVKRHFNY
ncbi:hypothetical protein O0Q50_20520 [Priestia aryabhattai]|uniref:Uncharacterized protein n=1 Tax=Priestia aryabhattai TaxID=412384 RepID=A0AAX6NDJ1_PRIAR|nr:hypothetical protein [Priestia aryabhattai]MDU9693564.1 hypothetical protein [Priestia aryabhattai]